MSEKMVVGMKLEEAKTFLAENFPHLSVRIGHVNSLFTCDYIPSRINLLIDNFGYVVEYFIG